MAEQSDDVRKKLLILRARMMWMMKCAGAYKADTADTYTKERIRATEAHLALHQSQLAALPCLIDVM